MALVAFNNIHSFEGSLMILNYPQKNSYELNGNESDAVF